VSISSEETKKPPMIHGGGGRPAINYAAFFELWVKSDLTKKDFFKEYGMNPNAGNIRRNTKHWTKHSKALRKAAIENGADKVAVTESESLYQMVMQWRSGQARSDYEITEAIKVHIKMILNHGVTKQADGSTVSSLKPSELKAIAGALESVQKVQRLALGMSTENVGVDFPEPDSNVETPEQIDDGPKIPVFVVEVSESGKFKRARPRQIA